MNIYPLQEPADPKSQVWCWFRKQGWQIIDAYNLEVGCIWESPIILENPAKDLQEKAEALSENLNKTALCILEQIYPGYKSNNEGIKRNLDKEFYKSELGKKVLREYDENVTKQRGE